jgi:hypothetical protein
VASRIESWRESNTLTEHLNAIFEIVPISFLLSQNQVQPFETAYINVGVFYDTVTCTVEIPYACVEMLKEHGVGIQISCYPSKEMRDENVSSH